MPGGSTCPFFVFVFATYDSSFDEHDRHTGITALISPGGREISTTTSTRYGYLVQRTLAARTQQLLFYFNHTSTTRCRYTCRTLITGFAPSVVTPPVPGLYTGEDEGESSGTPEGQAENRWIRREDLKCGVTTKTLPA